jgi:hypothetical protein
MKRRVTVGPYPFRGLRARMTAWTCPVPRSPAFLVALCWEPRQEGLRQWASRCRCQSGQLDWEQASLDTMSVRANAGSHVGADPVDRDKPGSKLHLVCDGSGRGIEARIARREVESSSRLGRGAFVLVACAVVCFNQR